MGLDICVCILLIFFSLFLLTLNFRYFLLVLIVVELLVMNISVMFYHIFSGAGLDLMMIYYLVFSVCESVMGLAVLVLIIRYSGGDYYFMFNLSKF